MSNFVIRKGQLNNCILTLQERSQLLDPYYLVVFKSKYDTDGMTTYTSLKSSVSNERYDLLEITETTSPNQLNGEVFFANTGEYAYEVYESNTQEIDPANTTQRVLQKGFIIVDNGII